MIIDRILCGALLFSGLLHEVVSGVEVLSLVLRRRVRMD